MITFEEAKELSKGYKVVPISMEIMSDIRTPMQVLRILKGVSSHCYMLESVNLRFSSGKMGKIYIPRIRSEVRDYLH